MVVAAALGAWFGAGIVVRLPRRAIQVGMGVALLIAGAVFAAHNLGLLPGGGEAMDLVGWQFPFAVGASLVLGALMTIGIGMYAPTMILLALDGHAPARGLPGHDGRVRAADAGRGRALRPRPLARPGARRSGSRSAPSSACRSRPSS